MSEKDYRLIGRGVYTVREAERLTRVPARRVRRWTRGYSYVYRAERRYSPPIVANAHEPMAGTPVLDFGDLIEIRFLNAFREHGVGWRAIRIAAQRAKELLGRHHPFSSRVFKTDGRTILAELVAETGDRVLIDLVKNQYEFQRIISPMLYAGIEFDRSDDPLRWWPLGEEREVVIDPMRLFGAPVVSGGNVLTRVLADLAEVEASIEAVAAYYELDPLAVVDAVEFEAGLAA